MFATSPISEPEYIYKRRDVYLWPICDEVQHADFPNCITLEIDKAFITTNSFGSRETFFAWYWGIKTHLMKLKEYKFICTNSNYYI